MFEPRPAGGPPLPFTAGAFFWLWLFIANALLPLEGFQIRRWIFLKGKVAFGFFCQKTEGVFSLFVITSCWQPRPAGGPPFFLVRDCGIIVHKDDIFITFLWIKTNFNTCC